MIEEPIHIQENNSKPKPQAHHPSEISHIMQEEEEDNIASRPLKKINDKDRLQGNNPRHHNPGGENSDTSNPQARKEPHNASKMNVEIEGEAPKQSLMARMKVSYSSSFPPSYIH